MKNNFEKLIKKAGSRETLSAAERDKMRYVLTEYMAFKPLSAAAAPAQGFFDALREYLVRPAALSVLGVLLLVLASGGIAYAAEGTLPGDTLYPIKVGVLEPIRTALTFSPTAQIEWHVTLAERRVDEASTLANEGKLSSTTEAALIANFSANSNAATEGIEAQKTNDPLDAVVAATNFSAQLGGYETVLAQIDSKHTSDTQQLQGVIRAQIALSDQSTVSDEPTANSGGTSHIASAATSAYLTGMQQKAIHALHTSAGLLDSTTNLTSSSSVRAEGQFDNAAQSAAQGTDLLSQHNNNGAFHAFQNSLSDTARLDVLTHAAATLHVNTFASTSAATSTDPSGKGTTASSTQASSGTSATSTITTPSVTGSTHSSSGIGASPLLPLGL